MFDDPRSSDDPRDCGDDARDRGSIDPRDAFVDKLHLPTGPDREIVRDRDREYTLRQSESRTLSIVGSFRVVSSRDLRDHDGRPLDANRGDLRHLREQGLVRAIQVDGHRDVAVVLTGLRTQARVPGVPAGAESRARGQRRPSQSRRV